MNDDRIDLDRLVSELRRVAEKLDRLSRRTTTVESLVVEALGSLGPLSAYKLAKVTRRGRERLYAALRSLEKDGRIVRSREGYRLPDAGDSIIESPASVVETERREPGSLPPVDPQIRRARESDEAPSL